MFPTLLQVGSLNIQSYGFFIALGYLAAVLLIRRRARIAGLAPADFSDLCFVALLSGVLGARALFVLTNLSHFREHPGEILVFWSGGLVFFGGFLLAFPICVLMLRAKKLPVLRSLDLLAPGLALGHGIGRIGCFAAGCCHGKFCEYPWGVRFDTSLVEPTLRGLPVHPTQLYESAGLVALCGIMLFVDRSKPAAGRVAALYLIGYGVLRIVIEMFRGDSIRGTVFGTPVSTSQLIAFVLLSGGCALWIRSFRGVRRNH